MRRVPRAALGALNRRKPVEVSPPFETSDAELVNAAARAMLEGAASSANFGGQRMPVAPRLGGEVPFYEGPLGNWWLGKCNFCQYALLVLEDGQLVHPAPQPAPVSEAIPEVIRNDLREAKPCLAVGAWNAAVVMARRALQCAGDRRQLFLPVVLPHRAMLPEMPHEDRTLARWARAWRVVL